MFINKSPQPGLVPIAPYNASNFLYNLDISPTGMFALELYAFGGLAFMICVILFALGLWVRTVVIRREWADSPPDIELHPERMRKKEIARAERLKVEKEEKKRIKEKRLEQKFSPPPIRLDKKERKSSFSSTTSTLRNPNQSLTPVHKPAPRKSSLSTSPSKGLRVSWASSAGTVDVDGHTSEKSIKSNKSDTESIKFPFDSSVDAPTPIPRARRSVPRLSTSIEARAPRGDEMIAATTPDVCESWSKPANPNVICRCWDSVDPLDTRKYSCDIHR